MRVSTLYGHKDLTQRRKRRHRTLDPDFVWVFQKFSPCLTAHEILQEEIVCSLNTALHRVFVGMLISRGTYGTQQQGYATPPCDLTDFRSMLSARSYLEGLLKKFSVWRPRWQCYQRGSAARTAEILVVLSSVNNRTTVTHEHCPDL
jgi:hypothetical protein